jgi:hypothetical protein
MWHRSEILILPYFQKKAMLSEKIPTFVGYGSRKDMEIA